MDSFSYISNSEPQYIESLYRDYKNNPSSVDKEWGKFFEGFDFAVSVNYKNGNGAATKTKPATAPAFAVDEFKVWNLIQAYRHKGHLIAKTNPIRPRKDRKAGLDLKTLGFTEQDLDRTFESGNLLGLGATTLRNIIEHLQKIYCSSIGIEYTYITDTEIFEWFRYKIEKSSEIQFDIEKKKEY